MEILKKFLVFAFSDSNRGQTLTFHSTFVKGAVDCDAEDDEFSIFILMSFLLPV